MKRSSIKKKMHRLVQSIFIRKLYRERDLLIQFVRRDLAVKHKGSWLGVTWTAINPIIMLLVYTIIFSQVFNARWGSEGANNDPVHFGLNLFCGLIVFNVFSEIASRSPTLITDNPNFVKKIIFPLHILGATVTGSALIQGLISISILIIGRLVLKGELANEILYLPIVWAPLITGTLGLSWLLSAVGVYVRDVGQIMNAAISILMFMSPIFYPTEALPESIRWIATVNPLATVMENTRSVIMQGSIPDTKAMVIQIGISILWCQVCYVLFDRVKLHFGDEL